MNQKTALNEVREAWQALRVSQAQIDRLKAKPTLTADMRYYLSLAHQANHRAHTTLDRILK